MNSKKYLLLCNVESTTVYDRSRLQNFVSEFKIHLHPTDTFYFVYYGVIFFFFLMYINAYYNAYFNDFISIFVYFLEL
jgi:hypothetical protein